VRRLFSASLVLVTAAAGLQAQSGQGATPAAAATPATAPPRIEVPYTQFTLSNGLQVVLHRDARIPMVAVNTWYHVGSASEKPGRTGFAHLFEHLMFEGSEHVPEGAFDQWLEAAGGNNNGSTSEDRTNYVTDVPANALELALFLESDRMGFLLPPMTPARVDGQRDVVKNERRQSVENTPYAQAYIELNTLLYPKGHPYSWPVIGSMEDLSAASHADVVEFFKTYYAPNNASLVVAGDIDVEQTKALVEKWFGEIPRGNPVPPIAPPAAYLTETVKKTVTDRVQLERLMLAWHTPRIHAPADAALDVAGRVLAGGKNSRLYKRLVYDLQVAQDVDAGQQSQALSSIFLVGVTARPGKSMDDIRKAIDEEIAALAATPPATREMARAVNQIEAQFYRQMERVGGFYGKANQLNAYLTETGMPDWFAEDLARYQALSATDVQAAVRAFLAASPRVELLVVPEKK
jgi:zinc protease